MKTNNKNIIAIFVAILVIVIISGIIYHQNTIKTIKNDYKQEIDSTKQAQIDFFKEYIIAVSNINIALGQYDVADFNLHKADEYIITGQYYYADAKNILDYAKEQSIEAKELLNKARRNLDNIKGKAPNPFFEEDIKNRIEQLDTFYIVLDDLYNSIDFTLKELYEINYGSEEKSAEYYKKYNDLIPKYNQDLKRLSDISNKIDLNWDQDWYVTFQG